MRFLSALVLLFSTNVLNGRSIQIGFIDYHPLVSNSPEGPTGYLIDYVDEIFKNAGLTPKWRELSVNRGLIQLQNGQLDAYLTILKTPERAKLIEYSQTPLFETSSAVCSKPQKIKYPITHPLRMVHFLATPIPEALRAHTLIPVTPDEVTKRMLNMLEKDRTDAVFYVNPEVLALSLAQQKLPVNLECHILTDIASPVYMGFGNHLSADLKNKLNATILEKVSRANFSKYIETLFAGVKVKTFSRINVESKAFLFNKSPDN